MLDDRIVAIARAKVRPSLFGCQLWLTFEQYMGSYIPIHGDMTADFVLISNLVTCLSLM